MRRAGLLGRKRLEPGEGLWISPCESVHTFFMKFPIDLVYLDKSRKVRKVRHAVPPWRLSMCLSAHSILELPAGTAKQTGTVAGDGHARCEESALVGFVLQGNAHRDGLEALETGGGLEVGALLAAVQLGIALRARSAEVRTGWNGRRAVVAPGRGNVLHEAGKPGAGN